MLPTFSIVSPSDISTQQLIADWYDLEWRIEPAKTHAELASHRIDGVPFQLLMTLGGEPVGTGGVYTRVGLADHVPRYEAVGPWLALMYTVPSQRRKGLGARLCSELHDRARDFGATELYLFTSTAERLYRRMGYKAIEILHYRGREIVVMRTDL